MHASAITATALLPLLASAHFQLTYPKARGFDDDKATNFPCGGFNTISTRTSYPLTGGPIQLDLGHAQTNFSVLLAVGNSPGDAFNYVLKPIFTELGLGNACIGAGGYEIPAAANVSAGTNATLQVVSNADGGEGCAGLYQCADITFTSTRLTTQEYSDNCKNNSGNKIGSYTGPTDIIANVSDCSAAQQHSHAMSGSSTSTTSGGGMDMDMTSSAAAASATSSGVAAQATVLGGLVMGAMGAVGLAVL